VNGRPLVGIFVAVHVEPFRIIAAAPDPPLDELLLALAAEFHPIDADRALRRLDRLAERVDPLAIGARAELAALVDVLDGFAETPADGREPAELMLDLVLEQRRGAGLMIEVVRKEIARRVGIAVPFDIGAPHDTALFVRDDLVAAFDRWCDLANAIHAARLRLLLPTPSTVGERHEREAMALVARLN
jgi:hypothetical protein